MINVLEFERGVADGGAETLVKDYCLLIDKKKFNVLVACLFANEKSANYKLMAGNKVKIFSIYRKWNMATRLFNRIFGEVYVSYRLKRYINQNSINVVHGHVGVLKYLKPISNFLHENKVKLLYTCHNLPEQYFGKKQGRERTACVKLIKNNNLQLIALHADMAAELNQLFGINNTIVVNNGIDFSKYETDFKSKEEIRQELGIPKDAFVIGNIAKFAPQKNHRFIIEVLNELLKKNNNGFLILVGAGPLKEDVIKQIKGYGIENRVLLLSHRNDVPVLLHAMDCFFFPSLFEGLGIVVVEAQKAGVKAVVADTIPKAAYLSSNLIVKSLQEPLDAWVNAILYESANFEQHKDINEWDMRNVIKKLENIYQ